MARSDYALGYSKSVAVGDFNGDGKPDIVTVNSGIYNSATGNYDNPLVSVLLNNGNGAFAAKTDYAVGSGPVSVAVGDFNGDGKPDLVTVNSGIYNSATGNYDNPSVSVLLNNGNGTFAARRDYAAGNTPRSVAVGDFNGDGKPDIVTANVGINNRVTGNYDNPSVSVLLNNGNGTFAAKTNYAVGKQPPFRCYRGCRRGWQARYYNRETPLTTPSASCPATANGTFAARGRLCGGVQSQTPLLSATSMGMASPTS